MLDLENPDLFKWLTGQEAPPQELESNLAFQVTHSPCCKLTTKKLHRYLNKS